MTTPIKIYDPLLCLLQRRAVQWMQRQERASEQVPDANWRYLQTQDRLSFWVATHTGDLMLQEPPMQRRCPGGLFCDEPVSFMSILKILYDTKTGSAGRPPPGNAASLTHSRHQHATCVPAQRAHALHASRWLSWHRAARSIFLQDVMDLHCRAWARQLLAWC